MDDGGRGCGETSRAQLRSSRTLRHKRESGGQGKGKGTRIDRKTKFRQSKAQGKTGREGMGNVATRERRIIIS
jgi:hypothetical protein